MSSNQPPQQPSMGPPTSVPTGSSAAASAPGGSGGEQSSQSVPTAAGGPNQPVSGPVAPSGAASSGTTGTTTGTAGTAAGASASDPASSSKPPTATAAPGGTTPAAASTTAAGAPGTSNAAAGATAASATSTKPKMDLTDQAVLDYLQSRGLSNAALELQKLLEEKKKDDGPAGKGGEDEKVEGSEKKDASGSATTAASTTATATTTEEKKDSMKGKEKEGVIDEEKKTARERLEEEEAISRNQRSLLSKSTGGGYGYDRDAAWPIAQWGVPDVGRQITKKKKDQIAKSAVATGAGAGAAAATAKDGDDDDDEMDIDEQQHSSHLGVAEARAYLDSFTAMQLWVLSLPDHDGRQTIYNPIRQAQKLLLKSSSSAAHAAAKPTGTATPSGSVVSSPTKGGGNPPATSVDDIELADVIQELTKSQREDGDDDGMGMNSSDGGIGDTYFHLPPSAKPELLAVTFALLVHTYCELLEVGMESTAHTVRDAFRPVYDGIYRNEYRDLYQCTTVEDIVRLNSHNSQHMEALSSLKSILVQVASCQLRREELNAQAAMAANPNNPNQQQQMTPEMRQQQIQEMERNITILKHKYSELSQRASLAFDKMHDLPFLRRARAVRWQLTLSSASYGLLASYLSDDANLAMSTLLQNKCELHIEQRDPLPFVPTVVLDESADTRFDTGNNGNTKQPQNALLNLNKVEINWAAPVPNREMRRLGGAAGGAKLPYPKYHYDDEYETEEDAERDKRIIEFNRTMLINGFRRLEALERKRDYESMSTSAQKRFIHPDQHQSAIPDPSTSSMDSSQQQQHQQQQTDDAHHDHPPTALVANPLEPTILLTTLCASSGGPVARQKSMGGSGATGSGAGSKNNNVINDLCNIWEEPGIGLTCAKIAPPDGRRIAVGCDDSCIRIWDVMDAAVHNTDHPTSGSGSGGGDSNQPMTSHRAEPSSILIGHKNGFPVFEVDWNRDGRTLLSAGGDGSVRLWDTMAVGPFGDVVPVKETGGKSKSKAGDRKSPKAQKSGGGGASSTIDKATQDTSALKASKSNEPDMDVPGWRAEDVPYASGAALAVYRGHAPGSPVWSVSFAPCGYYFASAGADATARLWTTEHPVPVRLFCGHTSSNVNCVEWHPNCNYIVTGSDDKTARLWDIQTGRTVRLLDGCGAGVNVVKISPGGRYLAGADYSGVVHLWDLGMGKKITEFRSPASLAALPQYNAKQPMVSSGYNAAGNSAVHRLSFSACGSALAAGGDDCCVTLWDVRNSTIDDYGPVTNAPIKSFQTRQTLIMDLSFTKRNLLLSVGKYVTPVLMNPDAPQ